ncbi:Vacuolar amino acid transporter 2 [Escovopsis weberi]|uniref:Vacuolar amino acid transporter 2 n=1 Tax=Escovopsis weberi TaxID=150374 RepID=A0A0M8N1H0_ESCWE|nr:Vacuolar amino acid transporter 2 [Escovopsis weberi]
MTRAENHGDTTQHGEDQGLLAGRTSHDDDGDDNIGNHYQGGESRRVLALNTKLNGGGGGGGGGGEEDQDLTARHNHHDGSGFLGAELEQKTPRTPGRVQFDLTPHVVGVGAGYPRGRASTSSLSSCDQLDMEMEEDADLYHAAAGPGRRGDAHRVPLLTDMEAPSVTVARAWGGGGGDDDGDGDGEGAGAGAGHAATAAAEMARPKSGLRSAFMNMANSIIGAGIIGQPYAMRQAGLVAGTALLVGLTVMVDWTIRLIVINSKLSGTSSFQGTVEHCFGRAGLVAISLAQWVFAFGGMVAFGVIVGDTIPHVLAAVWPELATVPGVGLLTDRRVAIAVFVVGLSYPLTLYRDIAKLARASTFALAGMVIIVVTVLAQGALVPRGERGSLGGPLLVVNGGVFQAIGVISFAFVCHHNSLLIYGSLRKPTIDNFSRVTHLSTGVSMLACLAMALGGFLVFGDRTLGNVLNNFPPDNAMVNVARLAFGLNMLTTLPLEAFVCREVMLTYFWPGEPFRPARHVALSTALVAGAMALSLATCDLGVVFELVGSTSAVAMAYILPPLCYVKLTTRSWRTYVAWGVVCFGVGVMVISVIQAVDKMFNGSESAAQCT